eukprot:5203351-Amphidinium_carterae.2
MLGFTIVACSPQRAIMQCNNLSGKYECCRVPEDHTQSTQELETARGISLKDVGPNALRA